MIWKHTIFMQDDMILNWVDLLVSLTGDLAGDGFPSSEAFVTDAGGKNKVFLGVGAAKAGPNKGPFVTLVGDKKEKQFDINFRIAVDKKGRFTGV